MKSNRRRALAVVAPLALFGLLGLACGEQQRALGEDCLKGDDCLSGTCSGQKCVAAPPIATGATGAPDATVEAAATDSSSDADDAAPADTGADEGIRDSGGDE